MQIGFIEQEQTERACKERGIRISGPPLGRPPAIVSKSKKKQAAYDKRIRNAICQKVWGLRKRRFGLNRVMAKLDNASGTVMAITFLVMNLATWWRRVFCVFLCLFGKSTPVFWLKKIYNYTWGYRHRKNLSLTELEYIARSCYWFAIDYSAKPK